MRSASSASSILRPTDRAGIIEAPRTELKGHHHVARHSHPERMRRCQAPIRPDRSENRCQSHSTCTGCQKTFRLRDEMAGRKVRCPECEAVLVVPARTSEEVSVRARFRSRRRHVASRLRSRPLPAAAETDRPSARSMSSGTTSSAPSSISSGQPISGATWAAILAAIVRSHLVDQRRHLRGHAVLAEQCTARAGSESCWRSSCSSSASSWPHRAGIKLSPKRHISFFTDESKEELLLQVLQDKKFQPIVATYTVLTARGRRRSDG